MRSPDARQYLEQTVKLRPDYPEAWNNLGMLDAQEGHADEAVRNFLQSLDCVPTMPSRSLTWETFTGGREILRKRKNS